MANYEKTKYSSIFKTESGKFVYITRMNGKTMKSHPFEKAIEAKSELEKIKFESRNNYTLEDSNLPTFEEVCNEYLAFAEANKAQGTVKKIRKMIVNHFYSIIPKDTKINKVATSDNVLSLLNNVNNANFVEETKRTIINLFIKIIERGKIQGYIEESQLNYVLLNLRGISFKNISEGLQREKYFYTFDEFTKYIAEAEKHENKMYKVLFDVLFYCGLRVGELLGLRACSLNGNMLTIDHQVLDDGTTLTSQLKTKNSKRCIYITNSLSFEIEAYKEEFGISGTDLLFPCGRTTIRRVNKLFSDKANIEYLNIHGFRHSCVAMLMKTYIENKIPINFKQIAEYIGDTVQTVLDVYSHVYDEDNTSIINLLPQTPCRIIDSSL